MKLGRRYRFNVRKMLEALGPDLTAETTWKVADESVQGAIGEVFDRAPNIHKFRHYLPVYASAIPRDRPIRMLEIGVARGGSLQMWREYLHPESVIVGVDIDPGTKQFDDPDHNVHVRIGRQQDAVFLRGLVD